MAEKLVSTKVIRDDEHPGGSAGCSSDELRLGRAAVGEPVEVIRIYGDERLRGRMMAIGIVPGARLCVAHGGRGGPIVVALDGSRLILDEATAEAVGVTRHRGGPHSAGQHEKRGHRHRERHGWGQR